MPDIGKLVRNDGDRAAATRETLVKIKEHLDKWNIYSDGWYLEQIQHLVEAELSHPR